MAARCRIELFGGLRIIQEARTVSRFRTRKTAALLAYLAYHPDRPHPREALSELLWPWAPPASGRHSLSCALSSLRHQLQTPGEPGAALLADRDTVRLNAALVTTDAADFDAALRKAEAAPSKTAKEQQLAEVVRLYRGELLSGLYEPWIPAEQVRRSEQFVDSAMELSRFLTERGDDAAALSLLRKAVEVSPLREEPYRELITRFVARGERGAALETYRALEEVFKEELGAEPSSATRRLAREAEKLADRSAVKDAPSAAKPALQRRRSPKLPTGTVTFLIMRKGEAAFTTSDQDSSFDHEFRRHGGITIDRDQAESVIAFSRAEDAVNSAAACQRIGAEHSGIHTSRPVMAIHTAETTLHANGRYEGGSLARARRLLAAAHPSQILCSEATAGLLLYDLNGGLRLCDLGVYRFPGATSSERVFQLDYPGRPEVPTPLRAESGHASHLPLELSRFFGRQKEIEHLTGALSDARLVTLIGSPGCGKTRLGIEVARKLMEAFRGAVWFVPLADLRDESEILDRTVRAMGLPQSPQTAEITQVVGALSNRQALLAFDNAEHLTETTAVLRDLLERIPGLHCLVTSRRPMGLKGEQVFPLSPLAIPIGTATFQDLLDNESVQLYVDRAQAVQPDFQLTPGNGDIVAEICRRLEGVPLGIEIVAAHSNLLGQTRVLEQLTKGKPFTSRRRDDSERHRSLQDAVRWSYSLLSPELQRFFGRLSVFRGGWTAEAAEAVCEEPQALDYLTELMESSLVLATQEPLAPRFSMLETLREYAAEHLAASCEQGTLRDRHLDYFLDLSERIWKDITLDMGALLAPDNSNLLAALDWSQTSAQHTQAGLRLTGRLHWFWKHRDEFARGRFESERALAQDTTREPTAARASALLAAGCFSSHLGDYTVARTQLIEGLEISRLLGDIPEVAEALIHLGQLAREQGDLDAAERALEEALSLERSLGRATYISRALSSLGGVALARGDRDVARAYLSEARDGYHAAGKRKGEAYVLLTLGNLTRCEGDYELAASLLTQALTIAKEIGSRSLEASVLGTIAPVLEDLGQVDAARARVNESIVIFRDLDDKPSIGANLVNLAHINLIHLADVASGRETVRRPLLESLRLVQELGGREQGTWCLHVAAGLFAAEGKETSSPKSGRETMELAACLYGAAEALRTATGMQSLHSGEEPCPHLPPLIQALGKAVFDEAWDRGGAMTFEEALACALAEVERLPSSKTSDPLSPETRTRRC